MTSPRTAIALAALVCISCGNKTSVRAFGRTPSSESVELYTLTNPKGMQATISTWGGILVSLKVPDKAGNLGDVVLGFDDLDSYVKRSPFFGALVGRYANRIAHGSFKLNDVQYTLAKNNGENTLHGGKRGFDKRLWRATQSSGSRLQLVYGSPDGEEGFPGNILVTVIYTLSDQNELGIEYSATTDKDTIVNLTNHSYFNLAGQGEGDVLNHQVTIFADRFTPVDQTLIPTGELRSVEGTPLDFRQPHAIGERIDSDNEQIALAHGYDHNFVLNRKGAGLELAARVSEPKTGRTLEVLTTEPGVQFYTANTLGGATGLPGKAGKVYRHHSAFCLETQHYPDSPNHPEFPTTVLKAGGQYHSQTVYRFY